MPPFLLALVFPLAVSSPPSAVSSPTTNPANLVAPAAATAETAHATAVTEAAAVQTIQTRNDEALPQPANREHVLPEQHPWEFLVGFQHWGKNGNLGLGWAMGRHELRLLGPNTGIYLDYKATVARIKALRFNVGGLIGTPALVGGHVGLLYRTGGDSIWGRIAVGVDGGVSCARDHAVMDCGPAGGVNVGLHFWPSDFQP